MNGRQIKQVLEDVCDNLFNADPYYQQGGDMVRVGGMTYSCDPTATMGKRIGDMSLNGKPIEADKTYKVAGWAPVSEAARDAGGEPIWELVARHLRGEENHSVAEAEPSATEECRRQSRHSRLKLHWSGRRPCARSLRL